MFSFRQKILASYAVVFVTFIVLMFPITTSWVQHIIVSNMEERATEIISYIKDAPNHDALIRRLKDQKSLILFRISVIDNQRRVLYDTHVKRKLGPKFTQDYVVTHPEVMEALEKGSGYHVDFSELLQKKFAYYAKTFDFHGQTYILRTAFPYQYVKEITYDFEIGFLGIATIVLLMFSLMTWFVINYLTKPIQTIIKAVKPYQSGAQPNLPEIDVTKLNPTDDFTKLALTLNSLSSKIQTHIDTITKMYDMRRDFIANASHELKTPITIIRGFAEALHDNPDLPRSMQEEITGKIVRNTVRMSALIKDLLTLADIENIPPARLVSCNVNILAETCCSMLFDVFPEAQVKIDQRKEDLKIVVDPDLLELAVFNLIENAAKYSPKPAHITVTLDEDDGYVVIAIADKGLGIPDQDQEHIFERFYTVDKARSQKMGGSGLGLSIVKTIVEKHGGTISLESKVNIGSTFTIRLPKEVKDMGRLK